ncbi:hypothetical protein SISNIDRAFT_485142 [Sistotremastrum niveocremeum HHB9708]|uniref:protein S-acyltransferase n=1 Tax=Sistotremastrum niveocremeum HHB9708 TaxID=1314777 RepID=A0A164VJY8_9AGAM|nr:hypothetical protein SISNIDRAFT_485142 [Sistotremastrum niveocremeum HHB9708]
MCSNGPTLHEAFTRGDVDLFREALARGEDINEHDEHDRNLIVHALLQDEVDGNEMLKDTRLGLLALIVGHADVSLHSLNAPTAKGVPPLTLASWLDYPDAVRVLLESSEGCVLVDAPDALGATPLMYAARDGNVEVCRILLSYNARADTLDSNRWSAMQHAQHDPHILWLCEQAVREQRALEKKDPRAAIVPSTELILAQTTRLAQPTERYQLPPNLSFSSPALISNTRKLVSAILSGNETLVQTLLLPSPPVPHFEHEDESLTVVSPLLVNRANESGFAPLHFALSVQQPSIPIINALHRSGADMNLRLASGGSGPLHILASAPRIVDGHQAQALKAAAAHLVQNLGTSLTLQDVDGNNCLHVAAQRGTSGLLVETLLQLDVDGQLRKMVNRHGLLPIDVAKPEYRFLFWVSSDASLAMEPSLSNSAQMELHRDLVISQLKDCTSSLAEPLDLDDLEEFLSLLPDMHASMQCVGDHWVRAVEQVRQTSCRLDNEQISLFRKFEELQDTILHCEARLAYVDLELVKTRPPLVHDDSMNTSDSRESSAYPLSIKSMEHGDDYGIDDFIVVTDADGPSLPNERIRRESQHSVPRSLEDFVFSGRNRSVQRLATNLLNNSSQIFTPKRPRGLRHRRSRSLGSASIRDHDSFRYSSGDEAKSSRSSRFPSAKSARHFQDVPETRLSPKRMSGWLKEKVKGRHSRQSSQDSRIEDFMAQNPSIMDTFDYSRSSNEYSVGPLAYFQTSTVDVQDMHRCLRQSSAIMAKIQASLAQNRDSRIALERNINGMAALVEKTSKRWHQLSKTLEQVLRTWTPSPYISTTSSSKCDFPSLFYSSNQNPSLAKQVDPRLELRHEHNFSPTVKYLSSAVHELSCFLLNDLPCKISALQTDISRMEAHLDIVDRIILSTSNRLTH